MKTKVTVLGAKDIDQPEKKKIEFVKILKGEDLNSEYTSDIPANWMYIVFIRPEYGGVDYDLMYAYNENVKTGVLFLGHFNDGIV